MGGTTIRWGVLSTADINRQVLPQIRAAERCELGAVASRSERRAMDYAEEWDLPRAYGGYADLLADEDIDAVYISLPNSLHREWTVRSIEAGKHVLCEKPLVLTEEECLDIIEAAETHGVVVSEAFMYRHHPQTEQVMEWIDQGKIGSPMLVSFSFSFTEEDEDDIRLNPDLGGGSLWDLGCYGVHLARLVMGEEPVEAFGWQEPEAGPVDETFVGGLRFPSGGFLKFDSSLKAPLRTWAEIVGPAGSVRLSNPVKAHEGGEIELRAGGEQRFSAPEGNPYNLQAENFARQVLDGSPAQVPLSDSLGNVRAIEALYRAAVESRPIAI